MKISFVILFLYLVHETLSTALSDAKDCYKYHKNMVKHRAWGYEEIQKQFEKYKQYKAEGKTLTEGMVYLEEEKKAEECLKEIEWLTSDSNDQVRDGGDNDTLN